MSVVGEVFGIIACIAGVVSAYKDATVILQKIKGKRAVARAAAPSRLLEDSISSAPDQILREAQKGLSRFGPAFDKGDEIAIITLQSVTIELQRKLLERLRDAAYDNEVRDFRELVDATELGRDRTITAMLELKQRLFLGGGSTSQFPSLTPASTEASTTTAGTPISPKHHNRTLSFPASEAESPAISAGDQQLDISPGGSSRHHRNSILGLLHMHRRSNSGSNTKRLKDLDSPRESSTSQVSLSRNQSGSINTTTITTSPSLATFSYNDWEDDPAKIWGESSSTTSGNSNNERTQSVAIGPDTRLGAQRTSSGPEKLSAVMASPENDYLGFCKGAWKLQTGDRKAMARKSKEVTDGWSRSGYALPQVHYLRCAYKCCFASEMGIRGIWEKVITLESKGIKYRWPFLAKSHVSQTATAGKGQNHAYQCLFCVFLGHNPGVMHGTDLYLEHISASHRGQAMGEVVLYKASCVVDRVAADGEAGWDINFLPMRVGEREMIGRREVRREGGVSGVGGEDLMDREHQRYPAVGKTSSEGNDSLVSATCAEPAWNEGLSEFHWQGENSME